MSWGPLYLYYHCPECGKKFKYAADMISYFGATFGQCDVCNVDGVYEKEGARTPDDMDYIEIED